MNQRFTLDRQSFERFLAAVAQFQPLQQAYANRVAGERPSLLLYLLETLRAIDSGELSAEPALERIVSLARHITGAESAAIWLLTPEGLSCRASTGANFEGDLTRHALWARLHVGPDHLVDSDETGDRVVRPADALASNDVDPPLAGPSLLIAVLPSGSITGALAVYSQQPGAFTKQDGANLRLLAGLAQYVLSAVRPSSDIDDLYLPGVGTRAALGDEDGQSRLQPILRSTTGWLQSQAAKLVARSFSMTRHTSAAWQHSVKRTTVGLARSWEFGDRLRWNVQTIAHQKADAMGSRLSNTADSTLAALLSTSESSKAALAVTMRRLRRLRFWGFRVLIDLHEAIVSTWDDTVAKRAAAKESVSRTLLGSVPRIRLDWRLFKKAAPAAVALMIMLAFTAFLTVDRHTASANPTVGATQPARSGQASDLNIRPLPAAKFEAKSVIPTPELPGSHLRITDRATQVTLAALSPYEVRTIRRAADYGDDEAALQLAMLYELGQGMRQNCAKAAEWVARAAQFGNAAAEYNLGLRYRDGDGVEVNRQEAERWLRKAGVHDHAEAKRALALLVDGDQNSGRGSGQLALRTP